MIKFPSVFQSNTHFEVIINKIPETAFYAQSFTIPEISSETVKQYTNFNPIHHTSSDLQYSPLTINFITTEDLKNWNEILVWMKGLSSPESFEQYRDLYRGAVLKEEGKQPNSLYTDMSILIANSTGNSKLKYTFVDSRPTRLTGLEFSSTLDERQILTFSVDFVYNYFNLDFVS